MRRTIPFLAAIALCGLMLTTPGVAQEASCLVRITFDPQSLPLNYDTVNALLNSRGIALKAALEIESLRKMQQENPVEFEMLLGVRFTPMSDPKKCEDGTLLGKLTVVLDRDAGIPNAQQCADQILKAACAQLRADLAAVSKQDLERLRREQTVANDELQAAMQRHAELRAKYQSLCDKAGTFDLSRERIVGRARDLEHERMSLDMQLMQKAARKNAVAEQIAQLAKQAEAATNDDPVAAELEKVVELKETEVARMQKLVDTGHSSQQDLWPLLENVAKARADLITRRQAAAARAGETQIQALNQTLVSTTIDIAEISAQLQSVDGELKQMQDHKLLEMATQYEDELKSQMQLVEWQMRDTTQRCQELERRVRMFRPVEITILGGLEDVK